MCAAEAVPAAIGDDELASLFSIFPDAGVVILAVSGGADSTALLLLAGRWRASRASGPELVAATVDHGLRSESRSESEAVGALARRLGIPHHTLAWEGEKPPTGVEAAAREARYALLVSLAARLGASAIATAHTLDDQAETVLMRLAAGSGPAGLAGMRPKDQRQGIAVLRPLLGVRKRRLMATLARDGIAWAEDPMNADPRFARPRLRAAAAALEREGLTPERLARLARRMARWDDAMAHSAQALQATLREPDFGGEPDDSIDGWVLLNVSEEVVLRVLGNEIRAAAGQPHDARLRLERLESLWEAILLGIVRRQPVRRTLGGAVISLSAKGRLSFTRAAPRRTPAAGRPVKAAQTVHQK